MTATNDRPETTIREAARDRILVLDGASGTEIQAMGVTEEVLRGDRFAAHPSSLAGNNDLLALSAPEFVHRLHRSYLDAGADIVSTNTFSSTTVAQREYGLDDPQLVAELNVAAARIAREEVALATERDGRRRWVAGAIGPTNVTLSLSPRVEDPGFRALNFRALAQAYAEQIDALIRGGVDVLLIETIFDTLNAKAAIWAARRVTRELGVHTPLMVSGTITDRSGRTLSGQTVGAFWQSIRHADPLSVGLNCALGGREMRPYVQELSGLADTLVCAYPNAGLPNELGGYDEGPDETAAIVGEFATAGFVNLVGGCCGTTPTHIAAIAEAVSGVAPRHRAERTARLQLSGLEAFTLTENVPFVNVGERTNVTGSAKFRRLITNHEFDEALDVARQQVENGAQVIDVNMDEG
ncbi:MAG: dihydropteroate synthase, partial [Ilumatobacter sp.]|nr:dihydropteroate synthase [Ilumatobacter sp.]